MASHIDVLVGEYADGVQANAKAIKADAKCIANGGGGTAGTIYVGYISHDYHMLVYAAMLGGMENAARKVRAKSLKASHTAGTTNMGSRALPSRRLRRCRFRPRPSSQLPPPPPHPPQGSK